VKLLPVGRVQRIRAFLATQPRYNPFKKLRDRDSESVDGGFPGLASRRFLPALHVQGYLMDFSLEMASFIDSVSRQAQTQIKRMFLSLTKSTAAI
jgi:hypothetical protein